MNIEFHYNITYILARKAGFDPEDAYILAYSSQYVDDNDCHYYVNFKKGEPYISWVSQTMDITKPSPKRQKIYPLFHFIPGDPDSPTAQRKDGKTHPFNTTPDSENVRRILNRALETNNFYRIGVAVHAYADTWAHQNFLGIKDDFNAMPGLVETLLPNIGHADARHEPDLINNRWKDERLIEDLEIINNNDRFIQAAEKIFMTLLEHKNGSEAEAASKWEGLRPMLLDSMDESYLLGADDRARKHAYLKIYPDMPEYDKKAWRHAAVEKRDFEIDIFDRYWAKEGFYESHWYRFQEAVKAHRRDSLDILRPVYEQAEFPV
ncbi:MAG: hypothetical protein J7J52_03125 [Deltaproteobacteria bacterium]|nr:hypothetical protein [Deltaproteobacteria bacterium]